MKWKVGLIIPLLLFALSGCTLAESVATPVEVATVPVELLTASTNEFTLKVDEPPIVPGATFTPVPTVTPLPTATPPPPTPLVLISVEDFGSNRNPFTGLEASDPELLQRRPIAIKISNAPAKYTRPQSGLSQADIVFEHVTEGAITRFTALIYGQTPPNIGPVRSARLIDLEIPAMYDAALAYSGSSIGVSERLFDSDFRARILRPNEPGYYRTGENKPYEHTLYVHPEAFWPRLEEKGENRPPVFNSLMAFSEETPTGGQPARATLISYRNWTNIEWRFSDEDGKFYRWVDGEEHLDANNGQQISAANVVLLFVPHQLNRDICEHQTGSTCRAHSTEILLTGLGQAILLRDGQQYQTYWRRINRYDMITLAKASGEAVPMQLGNTWFQVIPIDYEDSFEIES
jgi:hypothetical protein